jgi:CDGSH-type Zn-finger protein
VMARRHHLVVVPYRDGPVLVRGPVRLLDEGGQEVEHRRSPIALCRCGKSRLRPFCDGTHKRIGFRAPGAPDSGGGATISDLDALSVQICPE